ncbi:MAG: CDP-diacylglycerol O-phosphatidyltransferase, partial [Rhodospirillales bacterium]|nr:CDP-diacylglycerol O-phosphatidyltransferase [Rhodospirillales bacterium]MCW9003214.1 CDP-diacylglycerol O-phosphatidyltransferase [Rhodospirillales bacterium]
FGVAPALLLYLWTMQEAGPAGWVFILLFSVCCALRLARFNTALEEPDKPVWAYNYFVGVPSPAGAGLVLLPMILSFEFDSAVFAKPAVVGVVIVIVATLLVGRFHTFSFKQFKVPHQWVLPTMLIVGLLAALLVSAPWATLSIILLGYLAAIPFGMRSYANLKRQAEALQGEGLGDDTESTGTDSDKSI